jgi:hypothetical protein
MESYEAMDPAAVEGLAMGVILVSTIIGLALYVFQAWCLMKIANKTGTENAWFAWLPILNIILILDIAQKPRLWALAIIGMIIPLLNIIVGLGILIGYIYLMMEVAEAVGKPKFWGVIAVFIAPVGYGYLALAD